MWNDKSRMGTNIFGGSVYDGDAVRPKSIMPTLVQDRVPQAIGPAVSGLGYAMVDPARGAPHLAQVNPALLRGMNFRPGAHPMHGFGTIGPNITPYHPGAVDAITRRMGRSTPITKQWGLSSPDGLGSLKGLG